MMKRLLFCTITMISSYTGYSQCPGMGSITANDKCIFISWTTEPARIPDSLKLKSSAPMIYRLVSSSATGSSPFTANYRNNSPGAGACNASPSDIPITDSAVIFTHTASGVDSTNCNYVTGVLPVTLISFDGRTDLGYNHLDWIIADAIDFKQFVVEKSTAGNGFKAIGSVAYDQAATTYSFRDAATSEGYAFYRLRLTDYSGQYSYSPIIRLYNGDQRQVALQPELYPNPAGGDQASVILNDPALLHTPVYLKSMDGRTVATWMATDAPVMQLPLSNLQAGMYLLQFSNGSIVKLIRQGGR